MAVPHVRPPVLLRSPHHHPAPGIHGLCRDDGPTARAASRVGLHPVPGRDPQSGLIVCRAWPVPCDRSLERASAVLVRPDLRPRAQTDMTTCRAVVAAVSLAIAFAVAACGDDRPGPGPTPPVTTPPPPPPPPPPTPPPPPPPVLGVTRILAFGDSMTEGTTSTPVTTMMFRLDPGLSRSYPFKLQTLATARYNGQTIEIL